MTITKIDYLQKIIEIKRLTKVVTGGKRITFRVVLLIGDQKQKIGIGIGHGKTVTTATDKAIYNGKKNLITISLTSCFSIPYRITILYKGCKIFLKPAKLGVGITAGTSIRILMELCGIKNITVKQIGSNNILKILKGTMLALTYLNKN
jgi:small subunit ribosomal protein S5